MYRPVCQYAFSKKVVHFEKYACLSKPRDRTPFFVLLVKTGQMIPIDAGCGALYNENRKHTRKENRK